MGVFMKCRGVRCCFGGIVERRKIPDEDVRGLKMERDVGGEEERSFEWISLSSGLVASCGGLEEFFFQF